MSSDPVDADSDSLQNGPDHPETVALRARVAALEEALLRDRAEAENQRKRVLRDVEAARKYGVERLLGDLLPVLDSLEKALEVSDGQSLSVEQLREGTEMTLRMLAKATEQHGLKPLHPLGETFNPEHHQAMAMQPSAEVAEGLVLNVMQKGYVLADRLVRPALVIVSRGAASA